MDNQQALSIAIEARISVYDAHFVALAIDLGTILITEDIEVIKNCPKIAWNMARFVQ